MHIWLNPCSKHICSFIGKIMRTLGPRHNPWKDQVLMTFKTKKLCQVLLFWRCENYLAFWWNLWNYLPFSFTIYGIRKDIFDGVFVPHFYGLKHRVYMSHTSLIWIISDIFLDCMDSFVVFVNPSNQGT
jgi:hypothetical protein